MARKTVTTIEDESPPEMPPPGIEAYSYIDDDDQSVAAESALEGLLSEFSGSGDAIVNVYRQIDGANNIAFLFKTTPTEMRGGEIMEKLRDSYGSGDYRVHVREGHRIVGNKGFSVEAAAVPETPAAKDNSGDMMAMMMTQMNNQQALMITAIEAFGNRTPPPAPDPAAQQLAMVQILATLKEIATPAQPPQADDGVERLIQGITLAQKLGNKEGETNTSDLLMEGMRQFAPAIAQATQTGLAHQQAAQGAPGAPQLAPPGPGGPGAPGQPQTPEQQAMFEQTLLRTQLKFLVKNAQEGRNPELYAELLLDQVGEEKLLGFIGDENAMEKLIALVPEVETVRPWFERMRVVILELTAPENADDNERDEGEFIPGTPMGGVIIPAAPDAVSDTPNDGDVSSTPTGGNGDAPHS